MLHVSIKTFIIINRIYFICNTSCAEISNFTQTMNCCWNFLGNLRVYVVIATRPRLFPSALFTLFIFVCTSFGLGCSLLKHALDIHEMVASLSNRDIVLFLLMITGKFVAYLMLLNLALIISSVSDSHSESDEESKFLSGLSESWGS